MKYKKDASLCTFWDTGAGTLGRWRHDGVVVSKTESNVTCSFTHLTGEPTAQCCCCSVVSLTSLPPMDRLCYIHRACSEI